jgi:hypothetical protein
MAEDDPISAPLFRITPATDEVAVIATPMECPIRGVMAQTEVAVTAEAITWPRRVASVRAEVAVIETRQGADFRGARVALLNAEIEQEIDTFPPTLRLTADCPAQLPLKRCAAVGVIAQLDWLDEDIDG